VGGEPTDFFVSQAGADRAWAEWVAWQLAEAGHSVELDVWDWAPGRNFVTAMSDALDRCDRVVALFSTAYFDRSRYTTEEWAAALLHMPGMEGGRLVPVQVEEVALEQMPAVLRPLVRRPPPAPRQRRQGPSFVSHGSATQRRMILNSAVQRTSGQARPRAAVTRGVGTADIPLFRRIRGSRLVHHRLADRAV
jgi:TIR domain